MRTIFFDLETSDFHPVGQILNYAFVEIDDDWNIRSCLHDKIKISRLQLPSPDAIAANKIDVLQHELEAQDPEHVAIEKIHSYLSSIIEPHETRLVGYNSSRFDIPYLRTSMIRNGLNPYFGGSIKYGDVLHAVKRLACDNEDFISKLSRRENGGVILKLESVTKAFGLLSHDAVQEHESLADVMLTIKLAKLIADNYGIDVRHYSAYEVDKNKKFDAVKMFAFSDEAGKKSADESRLLALLTQNKTQSLWINLNMFKEGAGQRSVFGFNKVSSFFFVKEYVVDDDVRALAEKARQELSHINFTNFYSDKNCDVEQFIYMLPMNEICSLFGAIWRRDMYLLKESKNKIASQLYLRHLCRIAPLDKVSEQIAEYAKYRYGGEMKTNKDNLDARFKAAVFDENFHVTYKELLARIDELSKNESLTSLMHSLKTFYENSDIVKVAGEHLLSIPDRVKVPC